MKIVIFTYIPRLFLYLTDVGLWSDSQYNFAFDVRDLFIDNVD